MFSTGALIYQFRGPWGVPVQVGSSILLLALLFVMGSTTPEDFFYSAIFFGLVMLSIYLHELGHAWGALIQGIPVSRVVLYGGGGFCEHCSGTPRESELIVAMGPIVNLTLWAICSLIAPAIDDPALYWLISSTAMINIFLAVLNLLPVLPLDGGRLLHLLFLRFMPERPALILSGLVGLLLAVLWIPLMILSFVFFGLVLFFIPSISLHWRMLRDAL